MVASRRLRSAAARAAAVFVVAIASAPAPVLAAPQDDLEAAQRRANQAAAELADATEELALAEDAVVHLQTRVSRMDTRVGAVRDQVRELAIRLYVEGPRTSSRFLRMTDANEFARAEQFTALVAGTSTDVLGVYRAEREDLGHELEALEREQESRAGALENLRRRQSDAVSEIDRLTRVVQQARAAEEADRRAQAAAAAAQTAAAQPASPDPATRAAPAAGPTTSRRSESPTPTTVPTVPVPAGDWICPVQGPHAFSNDFGASRGGGFTHQGNDLLAARGTPVVASVDGVVTQRNGAVSGLAYFLAGDDGNRYFGAHLDSFGESGRVTAGTVVGTVGNTGDASGGAPHLHFEIHQGGSSVVNPYPTLTKYC